MNSNQIRCFLETAKLHSFSRAAEKLYLSQPGVSKLIAALEKELGQSLFFRGPHRQAELTPAGRLYFHFFSESEQKFHLVREEALSVSGELCGEIRLGFLSGWNAVSILQPCLDQFQAQFPQVNIQISFYDPSPLREALLNHSLDAVVTLEDSLQSCSDLEKIVFGKVRRMLFISRNHPVLPGDRAPTLQDLQHITFFIVSDTSFDSRAFVRKQLETSGITPDIKIVPNVEHAIACVHSHMGAAVIDAWSREMEHPALWHIPLPSCNRAVLAWRTAETSPALKAFTGQFLQLSGQLAPDSELPSHSH